MRRVGTCRGDEMKTVYELREEIARQDMEYSEYMAALRDNLPVQEYMLHGRTALYAILIFVALGFIYYLVLPVIVFGSFTLLTWLLLVVAFLALSWAYYKYVYYPNEIEGFEEEELAQPDEMEPNLGGEGS